MHNTLVQCCYRSEVHTSQLPRISLKIRGAALRHPATAQTRKSSVCNYPADEEAFKQQWSLLKCQAVRRQTAQRPSRSLLCARHPGLQLRPQQLVCRARLQQEQPPGCVCVLRPGGKALRPAAEGRACGGRLGAASQQQLLSLR